MVLSSLPVGRIELIVHQIEIRNRPHLREYKRIVFHRGQWSNINGNSENNVKYQCLASISLIRNVRVIMTHPKLTIVSNHDDPEKQGTYILLDNEE